MANVDEKQPSAVTPTLVNQNGTTQASMAYVGEILNIVQSSNKPKITVKCDLCSLEFASQSVLDCHFAGSKHQKKLKSVELLKSLEPMQNQFERDEVSGVIRCTVCDITVNSPQLLATHMAGNKHRANAVKRERGEEAVDGQPPSKRACVEPMDQDASSTAATPAKKKKKKKAKSGDQAQGTTDSTNDPAPSIELPDCVTNLDGYFLCNPCSAHCNSEQQLTQHLESKKHIDKLRGPGRSASVGRRGKSAGRGRGGWDGDNDRGRGPWTGGDGDMGMMRGGGRGGMMRGGRGGRGGGMVSPRGARGGRGAARGGGGAAGWSEVIEGAFNKAMGGDTSFRGGMRGGGRGGGRGDGGFRGGMKDQVSGSFRGGRGRGDGFRGGRGGGYDNSRPLLPSYGGYGEGGRRPLPAPLLSSKQYYGDKPPYDGYGNFDRGADPSYYGSDTRGAPYRARGGRGRGQTAHNDMYSGSRTTAYDGGYGGAESGYGAGNGAYGGGSGAYGGGSGAYGGGNGSATHGGGSGAYDGGSGSGAYGGGKGTYNAESSGYGAGGYGGGNGGYGGGSATGGSYGTGTADPYHEQWGIGGGRGHYKDLAGTGGGQRATKYGSEQGTGSGRGGGMGVEAYGYGKPRGSARAAGSGAGGSSSKRGTATSGAAHTDIAHQKWNNPPPPPPSYDASSQGGGSAAAPPPTTVAAAAAGYGGGSDSQQQYGGGSYSGGHHSYGAAPAATYDQHYTGQHATHTYTEPLSQTFVHGNVMM